MKLLFLCLSLLSINTFATVGASLNIAPTTVYVNQKMGASLAVWNYYTNPNASISVLSISPQAWVTVGGASGVPVNWDKPATGPGQSTTISPGSSVVYRYSGTFFAPSVSPAYAGSQSQAFSSSSLLAVGTQTFSTGALVITNIGAFAASPAKTVTVLPLPLPDSQR